MITERSSMLPPRGDRRHPAPRSPLAGRAAPPQPPADPGVQSAPPAAAQPPPAPADPHAEAEPRRPAEPPPPAAVQLPAAPPVAASGDPHAPSAPAETLAAAPAAALAASTAVASAAAVPDLRRPRRPAPGMDIARPDLARRRKLRQGAYLVAATAAVLLVTFGVQQLQPAAPRVDRNTVYIDTVRRGPMVRQVRGTGTLAPEEIRWIPATTEGNVERILMDPGAEVTPASVIVELSNPELEQQAQEAELNLRAAETRYENRRVELESDLLLQRGALAGFEAALTLARLEAAADAELAKDGLVSALQLERKLATEREQETKYGLEQERLRLAEETMAARLAVEAAEVDRLRALRDLRRDQVSDLRVRAGMAGVLQQVPLEEGQRVTAGANLARVGDPTVLKAELRIAETQAQDVQVGQTAEVDTRNGVVAGRVVRIDPAVENGTVTVDVALEGELPRGARPDLTVDGTIELERLDDVVHVGRPVFGQEGSAVSLFRLDAEGAEAGRTRVRLGRASVNTVEVVEGLAPGDRVVLSDMSAWDEFDRVRLD